MRNSLGFYWKVVAGDGKPMRFVKYRKTPGGKKEIIGEYPEMIEESATPRKHIPRRGECGGMVYGPKGFRLCSKCAAEVKGEL